MLRLDLIQPYNLVCQFWYAWFYVVYCLKVWYLPLSIPETAIHEGCYISLVLPFQFLRIYLHISSFSVLHNINNTFLNTIIIIVLLLLSSLFLFLLLWLLLLLLFLLSYCSVYLSLVGS